MPVDSKLRIRLNTDAYTGEVPLELVSAEVLSRFAEDFELSIGGYLDAGGTNQNRIIASFDIHRLALNQAGWDRFVTLIEELQAIVGRWERPWLVLKHSTNPDSFAYCYTVWAFLQDAGQLGVALSSLRRFVADHETRLQSFRHTLYYLLDSDAWQPHRMRGRLLPDEEW